MPCIGAWLLYLKNIPRSCYIIPSGKRRNVPDRGMIQMRTIIKPVAVGLLCLVLMTGTVMAGAPTWLPGLTSGRGIIPDSVSGNPVCNDVTTTSCSQFKIDSSSPSGTYYIDTAHTQWVTVESYKAGGSSEPSAINWTSNVKVFSVIVKGGDAADVYTYGGNTLNDTSLCTPVNSKNSKPSGISHVIFCYSVPTPPMVATTVPTTVPTTEVPVSNPVPEFPTSFMGIIGIAGITGLALLVVKK